MENQRIRLSKSLLKDALMRLLQDKPLAKITVLELCAAAQINRTTFYKYYGTVTELLADMERDFLVHLNEQLRGIAGREGAVRSVLDEMFAQRATFCTLVRAVPNNEFALHLSQLPAVRALFDHLAATGGYDECRAKYIREFIFQGTFAVLYGWLGSEEPEPASNIAHVLNTIRTRLAMPE